jgi:hypothetical protein
MDQKDISELKKGREEKSRVVAIDIFILNNPGLSQRMDEEKEKVSETEQAPIYWFLHPVHNNNQVLCASLHHNQPFCF